MISLGFHEAAVCTFWLELQRQSLLLIFHSLYIFFSPLYRKQSFVNTANKCCLFPLLVWGFFGPFGNNVTDPKM